ncbi:ParA family protein, partial [Anaerovorax odorimutans]
VDLIPSSIELSGMEMTLVNAMSREFTMKSYLHGLKKDYDYILIDCMPSLGMLTINALAAADSVIVPVQAHYLPLKGMTQLTRTISKVQRQINPQLKVDGVLLTLADMRTNFARVTAESLRQNYGRALNVYHTVIPVVVKAAESSAAGKSIYSYDKNSLAAKAYLEFTKEVLRDGQRQQNRAESARSR